MDYIHPSNLYYGLRLKYALKKVSPFVLLGAVFFTMWICQQIVAIAYVPVPFNPVH